MSTPDQTHRLTCNLIDNDCIYQDLEPLLQLGQNSYIYQVSPSTVQDANACPEYIQLGMICMTLNHRMTRLRCSDGASSLSHSQAEAAVLAEKFLRFRGWAIRSLSEHLGTAEGRNTDMLMAGIVTLLLNDLQSGTSLDTWRYHLGGLRSLASFRGGYLSLVGSTALEPVLLCLWHLTVIGNTTCPASDLAMTSAHLDALELVLERHAGATTPFQMCPPPLFAEIIKINHLRMRVYQSILGSDMHVFRHESQTILDRVHDFSPELWACEKASPGHRIVLGSVYQAAVALYCILSLQSMAVLATSPDLGRLCSTHGRHLRTLVCHGLGSPVTKRFMLWPLVVLGVEAGQQQADDQQEASSKQCFVVESLTSLSYDVASYMPLMAKKVLQDFWKSGDGHWDSCFKKPIPFTVQLAVDISRIRVQLQ